MVLLLDALKKNWLSAHCLKKVGKGCVLDAPAVRRVIGEWLRDAKNFKPQKSPARRRNLVGLCTKREVCNLFAFYRERMALPRFRKGFLVCLAGFRKANIIRRG
jgi:hypothetical protein